MDVMIEIYLFLIKLYSILCCCPLLNLGATHVEAICSFGFEKQWKKYLSRFDQLRSSSAMIWRGPIDHVVVNPTGHFDHVVNLNGQIDCSGQSERSD